MSSFHHLDTSFFFLVFRFLKHEIHCHELCIKFIQVQDVEGIGEWLPF